MSGTLKLQFASDMPTASVEVVSPDLSIVGQMRMGPGEEEQIDVPSEASFIRVHLPSGRVVTLQDPGNFDRTIQLADLTDRQRTTPPRPSLPSRSVTLSFARQAARKSAPEILAGAIADRVVPGPATLFGGTTTTVELRRAGDATLVPARIDATEREAAFDLRAEPQRLRLIARTLTGDLQVQVPATATSVLVRADTLTAGSDEHVLVAVRIATSNPDADIVSEYLARGDARSAESMLSWVGRARELLFAKIDDPYAAAVGGYLLLRFGRHTEMDTWAKNLADWFVDLPDGAVIWAWQLIAQRGQSAADEINRYLEMAVARGLPVYMEGSRLLSEGLRLMEPSRARPLADTLNAQLGIALWSSPFTAGVQAPSPPPPVSQPIRVEFDVGIASSA
jgi:hypothetical protein